MGPYFSYHTGSTTRGRVSYDLPLLVQGRHLLILQAMDGVGNPESDSLLVTVAQPGETIFSQVAVYPNPGAGQRVLQLRSFRRRVGWRGDLYRHGPRDRTGLGSVQRGVQPAHLERARQRRRPSSNRSLHIPVGRRCFRRRRVHPKRPFRTVFSQW
ncbi:MAG: hypothetical protein MZU79_01735 [Anaerotruncus sp.]|nr:hypothetical protein [Anaerotruncus sp.]